jgi:hypothetical protein
MQRNSIIINNTEYIVLDIIEKHGLSFYVINYNNYRAEVYCDLIYMEKDVVIENSKFPVTNGYPLRINCLDIVYGNSANVEMHIVSYDGKFHGYWAIIDSKILRYKKCQHLLK